ncbi:MAG: CDGSH iron-sulfur domain-containing protein [Ginsengibacter sp.]
MESIDENIVKVARCEPTLVKVQAGKTYSWCTCGLSETQPFCDGKHKTIESLLFKPLRIAFEKDEDVWFCNCKRTNNPPYCDETHKISTGPKKANEPE